METENALWSQSGNYGDSQDIVRALSGQFVDSKGTVETVRAMCRQSGHCGDSQGTVETVTAL